MLDALSLSTFRFIVRRLQSKDWSPQLKQIWKIGRRHLLIFFLIFLINGIVLARVMLVLIDGFYSYLTYFSLFHVLWQWCSCDQVSPNGGWDHEVLKNGQLLETYPITAIIQPQWLEWCKFTWNTFSTVEIDIHVWWVWYLFVNVDGSCHVRGSYPIYTLW